jgi:hypothetical protein
MSQPLTSWTSSMTRWRFAATWVQLEEERALALREGLGGISAYMADLEAEIEHRRGMYLAAAVTEIATLRDELFGPQVG